jgi:hypothetical protein
MSMSATSATRLRVTFIGLTYVHLAIENIIYIRQVHVRHQRHLAPRVTFIGLTYVHLVIAHSAEVATIG